MSDTPAISVIVPVYKGVRFLREALDSVRAQTFQDWECVCVDDGAKDGSGALADRLAEEDRRIRVIHQANGGTSVARNTALSVVRGKYVAFLDEDDIYHPRFLEVLHDIIVRTGADIAGCERMKFAEETHPVFAEEAPSAGALRIADRPGIAALAADYYQGIPFEIWRNLYRTDLVREHSFPPGVRVEQDLYWLYTLLPKISSFALTDWIGYAWRESSIGGYLHPDPESLISLTRTCRIILDTVPDGLSMTADQRRQLALSMANSLKWNIRRPLIHGLQLSREESVRLRDGLRALQIRGADICRAGLRWHQTLRWRLFLSTGLRLWKTRALR